MVDPETIATHSAGGVGGGLLGAFLTAMGFRESQKELRARVSKLEDAVVYKDTCATCGDGKDKQYASLHDDVREIRDDIKSLLSRRRDDKEYPHAQ
jgi:hypothetical protein